MRLYREEDIGGYRFQPDGLELTEPQIEHFERLFGGGVYKDVAGLCRMVTRDEIEEQGWSLNPGRYVGLAGRAPDDINFETTLKEIAEEYDGTISETLGKMLKKVQDTGGVKWRTLMIFAGDSFARWRLMYPVHI